MRTFVNIFHHYIGTTIHKFWVAFYLLKFSLYLILRAITHDLSKYSITESKGFVKVIHKLKKSTYGSDEYKESLRSIKPSIEHHYKRNKHHPEYYPDGINCMNLFDIVEMWCDWKAASRRHKNGDIEKSIDTNGERFNMSEQLIDILHTQRIDES